MDVFKIQDKREKPRIETKVKVKLLGADHETETFTGNLSKSGVFLETLDPDFIGKKGDKIQFRLWLPNASESIKITGKIMRIVGPNKVGSNAGVGIELLRVETRQAKLFDRLVDRLIDARGLGSRKHPRAKSQVLVELKSKMDVKKVISENLSKGGLFLRANVDDFQLGETLSVLIVHPTTGKKFNVDAEVVHLRKGESGVREDFIEGIGIQFQTMSATRHQDLSTFLRSILNAKKPKSSK